MLYTCIKQNLTAFACAVCCCSGEMGKLMEVREIYGQMCNEGLMIVIRSKGC